MLKRLLVLLLLFPAVALGQQGFTRNDTAAIKLNPTNLLGGSAAVDQYGKQFTLVTDPSSGLSQSVVPVSSADINGPASAVVSYSQYVSDTAETGSTTTVINATTHSANVRDGILFKSGPAQGSWSVVTAITANTITVSPALRGTPANGNAFDILIPVPVYSLFPNGAALNPSLNVNISTAGQATSTGPYLLKNEDAGHTSGDAGVQILGVANTSFSNLAAQDDYVPIATNLTGAVQGLLLTSSMSSSQKNASFLKSEDDAFLDTNGLSVGGGQALSAIAQSVGTSGDVAPIAMDLGNRTVVTAAPSGQMVVGCNTAITTATTGSMIGAVASNFTFITSWNCTNTGGTASRVILEDGDGTDLANVMLAATTGNAAVTFPTPVRTNVVNKAIQVNVITSGSSTICCASGYTGTI